MLIRSLLLSVFFTLNRSFYLSTSSTPSVRAHSSSWRDKFCGHKATIQAATLYQVDSSSTMQCHCAGLSQTQHTYASYPDTLKEKNNLKRLARI